MKLIACARTAVRMVPTMFTDTPDWAGPLLDAARCGGEDTAAALSAARDFGGLLPLPGQDTATRWSVLAAVAAVNLTTARVLEAHSDALAILAEAGPDADAAVGATWGVFAAEAADVRLDALVDPGDRTATLTGTKPWCSLAGELDAALVTAHTSEGRRLFRVELRQPSVVVDASQPWVARGLRTVTSAPVHFDRTPATPVGRPGWYLSRPGFAWGGLGVAACWFGGAHGLLAALHERAFARGTDVDALHLGGADVALYGARAALAEAARLVDHGEVPDAGLLALRVRSVVADAVERVLRHAAHALGPGPLAFDPDHAARVADLELYVRQHHAERDLVALGRTLAGPA